VLAITDIWWWPTFFLMLQFNNEMVIWPTTFFIRGFCVFSFSNVDYDGVLSSPSSSTWVPFFYLTSATWLHCILKLVTHTCHHLDHFHFLASFYVQLLPMNISPFCSSPIDILLGIINESCSFGLSIQLAMDYPLELASNCSWNLSQTFVSLWHKFCIPTC